MKSQQTIESKGVAPGRPLRGVGKAFGDLRVRPKLIILHNLFFLVLTAAVYFSVLWALGPDAVSAAKWALAAALAVVYILAVLLLETVIMPVYVYRPLRMFLEADEAVHRGDRARELIQKPLIPRDEIGQIMRSRNEMIIELRRHEEELANALAALEKSAADLQRKNELLATAKRSLADQDRLASLGMLNAGVAHELNTPLAVLHGSIEKLIETVDDPAAQERLARMKRVTERLRTISECLLDFVRVRKPRRERVPLRKTIDEAWDLVSLDDRAAAVQFAPAVDPAHFVTGDPDRLVQVFANLFRNALNAIKPSGRIDVRSEAVVAETGPAIVIAVEDDGPGIPADVLPHVFEAFVTSRLDARGTGLGLAVAEGIIEQHGGRIAASNRPAGGARLEVRLPAAEPAATAGGNSGRNA